MKIFVTGQNGFLGRALLASLRSQFPDAKISVPPERIPTDDPKKVRAWMSEVKPDFIFHMAGGWGTAARESVPVTSAIFQALSDLGLKARVIVPGSAGEYGTITAKDLPVNEDFKGVPFSPYGLAKKDQSDLVLSYSSSEGPTGVVGRVFNAIGQGASRNSLVGTFISKVQPGSPKVSVGYLGLRRDFIDIEDVCQGLIAIALHGKAGEAYNIGSGVSITLRELLEEMVQCKGAHSIIEEDATSGADNPVRDIYASIEKIRALTAWSPRISWKESVSRLFL